MNETPNTDRDAIESLRSFAMKHATHIAGPSSANADKSGLFAFAHLCTAALNGEEWAVERVMAVAATLTSDSLDASSTINLIRATDCTRPAEAATYTLRCGTRLVRVIGKPRRIAGGEVVAVCWASDDESQRLRDGTVHPAHRAGFSWEEPVLNIDGYTRPEGGIARSVKV